MNTHETVAQTIVSSSISITQEEVAAAVAPLIEGEPVAVQRSHGLSDVRKQLTAQAMVICKHLDDLRDALLDAGFTFSAGMICGAQHTNLTLSQALCDPQVSDTEL